MTKIDSKTTGRSGGMGFLGFLTLIFITLKLTSVIAWSWWLVLLPLWGPIAFALLIMFVVVVVAAVSKMTATGVHKRRVAMA